MSKFWTLISLILISTGSIADSVVVDVAKIAGMSQAEVATYLGKPLSCGPSKHGARCQYEIGETEIVFIGGRADWITIEGINHIPFSKTALRAIGLSESAPSFANNFTMRWNAISGLLEVSIFKAGANSDYAYIKVRTK
ncbi:MAG: hypothetical protein ACJAR0_003687 [Candidatus Azotimanducaceae bacterium]|jgi:hypothetical protein